MNEIGVVRIATARPLFFDPYRENRGTGSFILIDRQTNATAGAGMILAAAEGSPKAPRIGWRGWCARRFRRAHS